MKLTVICIISASLSSCMTDAAGNRRVDPEARKFWGGVAVKVILKKAEADWAESGK